MASNWVRATRQSPCPICGKDGYCGVTADGKIAHCMRTESDRVSRSGGWLHRLTGGTAETVVRRTMPRPQRECPVVDWIVYQTDCFAARRVETLSDALRLPEYVLHRLRSGWDRKRFRHTFPMRDADGAIIGMQTRGTDGGNRTIYGSRLGLFYPPEQRRTMLGIIYICEGPTDCGALLAMNLQAVGRASNTSCHDLLVRYCSAARDVVVIADRDAPGSVAERATLGAVKRLCSDLRSVRILRLPGAKDAREYYVAGGRRADLECLLSAREYER